MNYFFFNINNVKVKLFYSIVFFAVSFMIYFPSLQNEFVWDDKAAVEINFNFNAFVDSLKPYNAEVKSNYYRPIVYLSYFIDSRLWDKNPLGYHISNNLFNSFTVLFMFWFVYYFFLRLGYRDYALGGAIVSSLLFLTHPIHVESVSWVSARTDVLCTLFFMLGVLMHITKSSNRYFVLIAFAAFYLSMISKELGILFLPLVVLMDFATGEIKKRSSVIIYIIYAALIVLYFYVRSQSHINITNVSDKNVEVVAANNLIKYLDILKVLAITYYSYIYKILFPVELNSFIYDITKDTYYLVGALFFLFFTAVVFVYSLLKKIPVIYVGIFWFLLTLGPSSLLSVIKMTPTSLAERYLYLPSIGFSIILGYIFIRLYNIDRYKKAALSALILILMFYSVSTINRQKVWASDLTLWKDASIKSEYACFPHNNYAVALREAGRSAEAIKQYLYVNVPDIKCSKADKSLLYNNFGVALLDVNQADLAIKSFEDSIRVFQYYFKPHMNLGIHYISAGLKNNNSEDFKKAKYYLQNAVELNPGSGDSHHYLSIVYKETGDYKNARIHVKKALRLGLAPPQKRDALRILNEIQNSDTKEN
ncbi:MAG: hypothetical protein GWM89_05050 [Candidatus Dadabacteria bacterium]|nr:hypothetical protein [Candidatus Dadabacteria bacterium]NIV41579.1 hypothetical protein [Candidatus Dadabacteria bacterium]NIX15141.1 hypothetical protein [Candidatus Dadabacteria bacterium]NIY21786.1 hypothetical protein [Candidatus Dadabacteria bacterium]